MDALSAHDPGFLVVDPPMHGTRRVRMIGEFDDAHRTRTAAVFSAVIDHGVAVSVDMSAVKFIDSSALFALVTAANHAEYRGTAFRIVAAPPNVRRLLDLAGLEFLLDTTA